MGTPALLGFDVVHLLLVDLILFTTGHFPSEFNVQGHNKPFLKIKKNNLISIWHPPKQI